METNEENHSKKSKNKLKNTSILTDEHMQNTKPQPAVDKTKAAIAPEEPQVAVAQPAEVEKKEPHPVHPCLKSARTDFQRGNQNVFGQLDSKLKKKKKRLHVTFAERTSEIVPKEPQLTAVQKILPPPAAVELNVTEYPQTSSGQTPKAKASDHPEAFLTGVKTAGASELKVTADEQTTELQREQVALLAEVERPQEKLQTQTAVNAEAEIKQERIIKILHLNLSDGESTENKTLCDCKLCKMEGALKKGEDRQKELDTSLARQREESDRAMAALMQAEEGLKKERLQWKEEKSRYLQSIEEAQQIRDRKTSSDDLRDKVEDLKIQMAENDKNLKPKKCSLWKRFCQSFK